MRIEGIFRHKQAVWIGAGHESRRCIWNKQKSWDEQKDQKTKRIGAHQERSSPKHLPPEKRFLALEDDELLDEVSLEIEVMAIMDEKEKEEKKPA